MDTAIPRRVEVFVLADDYAGMTRGLLAQHGVSYLVKATMEEGSEVTVLFDTGYNGEAVLRNMEVLGLSFDDVDYIVLSHNHYDHANGLPALLKTAGRKRLVPVIVGKGFFHRSVALKPRLRVLNHEWTREEAEALGARFIEVDGRLDLAPGVSIPGLIGLGERLGFENDSTSYYIVANGSLVEDWVSHEVSLAVRSRKGILLLVGCSHPGVASIARKASSVLGDRIHMVMGGFHLVDADEHRIARTIQALRELGVEKVVAGHCTGLKAEAMLLQAYGSDFTRIHTGLSVSI